MPRQVWHRSGSTTPRRRLAQIRVEILGNDGKPIDGFAAADCAEIYGDEPARPVAWRAGSALPAGRSFRLRFVMRDANLYALTLQ